MLKILFFIFKINNKINKYNAIMGKIIMLKTMH